MRPLTPARMRSGFFRVRIKAVARIRRTLFRFTGASLAGRIDSPADFAKWLGRLDTGNIGAVPQAWSASIPVQAPSRIGVALHAFYPELVDELIDHLAFVPVPFDLIVTNATGASLTVDRSRLPLAKNVLVLEVANHGRDILPLVEVVNAGLLDPYDLVLKVHTKRSEWRDHHELHGTGGQWRSGLLASLLGSVDNIQAILSAFGGDPRLGLVTAEGSLLGKDYWGGNRDVVAHLLRRLELPKPRDLKFAAGSMYWTRGFVLQGLRGLGLSEDDFEPESGQVDATTAHAIERLIGLLATEAGFRLAERSELPVSATEAWRQYAGEVRPTPKARVVPFYLPQFHPIPENDRWWGTGFTEWSNVAKGSPVFKGHDQPKLPGELGYYDLRDGDVVRRQTALAETARIAGFMYYHYWFGGQQLLERPILDRVAGDLDLPFCLMWANENWTRRWDGRESDILIAQRYEEVPTERFLEDVLPILRDGRYMRVDGRPLLAVYRPAQIPNLPAVLDAWRRRAVDAGLPGLFLACVDVAKEFHGADGDTARLGFDARLGFPPHNALWEWLRYETPLFRKGFKGRVLSYEAMVEDAIARLERGLPDDYFPGVMTGFDNTARRDQSPDIWYGSNPYTFRRWLGAAFDAVRDRPVDRRLIFINAWNEWAEGAVLEPTARAGRTFLLAVRDVLSSEDGPGPAFAADLRPAVSGGR